MNEKITQIKELLKARKTIEARNMLDELDEELEKLQTFFDEINSLVMNQGRSSLMSVSDIENLIIEYKK